MIIGVTEAYATVTGHTAECIAELHARGINWVRILAKNTDFETSQGVYNWTNLDTVVNAFSAAGFSFIINLATFNAWWLDGTCTLPTSAGMTSWGSAVINHYNGTSGFIGVEMGNEEFTASGVSGSCINGSWYYGIASGSYATLKAINNNLLIGCCAFISWANFPTWFNQFFAAGGAAYIDYLNFHYYPNEADPLIGNANVPALATIIQDIQSSMTTYSVNKPIYMTEVGWGRPQMSEGVQAKYVISALNICATNGVTLAAVYEIAQAHSQSGYEMIGRQGSQQIGWLINPATRLGVLI